MKKKIFMLLALVMAAMTASAYELSVGKSEHGIVAFKVGNMTVTSAEAGQEVTVSISPENDYTAVAVTAKAVGSWEFAMSRGIGMIDDIVTTKTGPNEFSFEMPTADVEVSAEYQYSAAAVSNVKSLQLVFDVNGDMKPGIIGMGLTILPVTVTGVDLPKQTGNKKKEISVNIPTLLTSASGQVKFLVTKIARDAFKAPEVSNAVVTKVTLPETDFLIDIEKGAMSPDGQPIDVVVPLPMLDDYALTESLEDNFKALKVSADVTPANKYWTFASGVDVVLPKGIQPFLAYTDEGTPRIRAIAEADLKLVGGRRGIKANNGVLMACSNGHGGDTYTVVASPGNQQSGTKPATTDAKSYSGNRLEPVVEPKHYPADEYLVLKDNKFHSIISSVSMVPACKAVLRSEEVKSEEVKSEK